MDILRASDMYVQARHRNRIGFPDDLEFALCRERGVIHVRSSSLSFVIWDFGANRRRVEALRQRYEEDR